MATVKFPAAIALMARVAQEDAKKDGVGPSATKPSAPTIAAVVACALRPKFVAVNDCTRE